MWCDVIFTAACIIHFWLGRRWYESRWLTSTIGKSRWVGWPRYPTLWENMPPHSRNIGVNICKIKPSHLQMVWYNLTDTLWKPYGTFKKVRAKFPCFKPPKALYIFAVYGAMIRLFEVSLDRANQCQKCVRILYIEAIVVHTRRIVSIILKGLETQPQYTTRQYSLEVQFGWIITLFFKMILYLVWFRSHGLSSASE